jgi:hypothetical protein
MRSDDDRILRTCSMAGHQFSLGELRTGADKVGLCELTDVTRFEYSFPRAELDLDFLPEPLHRLSRSELSEETRERLDIGMTKRALVAGFLGCTPPVNAGVPALIYASFRHEFERLWEEGRRADELFASLEEFCHNGLGYEDPNRAAAALGVVAFLLEFSNLLSG